MKRNMREELKNTQYSDTLASSHGLENHGLKHLNNIY